MSLRPPVLSAASAEAAYGAPGTASKGGNVILAPVSFLATGGERKVWMNEIVNGAGGALATVFRRYDYRLDGADTGSYSCRFIGGTQIWSRHAWAIAIDVNWLENPDGKVLVVDPLMHPNIPLEVVELVTGCGAQLARWGGDWDSNPDTEHSYWDAMHWEVIAHPLCLATGIIDPNGDDMPYYTKRNDVGRHVWRWTHGINRERASRDEPPRLTIVDQHAQVYDQAMVDEVEAFQGREGIPADGNDISGTTMELLGDYLEPDGTPLGLALESLELRVAELEQA